MIKSISDLIPDNKNANRGTVRGRKAIEQSLREYGAGRSILIDREGRIIGGNKTAERAAAAGLQDVIVVQTDGSQLVAVQRTDLDLENDPKTKALAIADNRAQELSLEWDPDVLKDMSKELDLKPFFADEELRKMWGEPDANAKSGGSQEIDPDSFDLPHRCPRCGFQFADKEEK
jgi:hypothetical protein